MQWKTPVAFLVLAMAASIALANDERPAPDPASERAAMVRAMAARPGDRWPRGVGHVVLALPGTREEAKGYHEPGGGFSPAPGTFGVALWVIDAAGGIVATGDDVPLAQVQQRLTPAAERPPVIETTTRHYRATWEAVSPGQFALSVTPTASTRVLVMIRGVGPAGGPVRALERQAYTLRVNARWRVTTQGAAIRLGEEPASPAPGWHARAADVASVASTTGWAFASVLPAPGPFRLTIVDEHPTPASPLPANTFRAPAVTELPDPRFQQSLDAQLAHLLMSLVGAETRPGEPTNYPLAWQRDGAYTVVALARAGQSAIAERLAQKFAEQDFFGGFGPEADAPGLSLWAISEVSAALRRQTFDRAQWPHVHRKALLIERMMDATRPWRHEPAIGPIVPRHRQDPQQNLVADAARDGLIVGRMDHGRPLLFVNGVSHLGLVRAAELADRVGQPAWAARWRDRAEKLRAAWARGYARHADNDRTFISALWPTWTGRDRRAELLRDLEARWTKARTPDGAFRRRPVWSYFAVAEAHQWLVLDRPDRVWRTLTAFWDGQQASPGLYTFSEGEGEENTFGRWQEIRGWVNPPHITPHYWTASELLLLQLAALAYVDESGDRPTLVIGAGLPRDWSPRPLSARGVHTRFGPVDWRWDGKTLHVHGPTLPVRAGVVFGSARIVRE